MVCSRVHFCKFRFTYATYAAIPTCIGLKSICLPVIAFVLSITFYYLSKSFHPQQCAVTVVVRNGRSNWQYFKKPTAFCGDGRSRTAVQNSFKLLHLTHSNLQNIRQLCKSFRCLSAQALPHKNTAIFLCLQVEFSIK